MYCFIYYLNFCKVHYFSLQGSSTAVTVKGCIAWSKVIGCLNLICFFNSWFPKVTYPLYELVKDVQYISLVPYGIQGEANHPNLRRAYNVPVISDGLVLVPPAISEVGYKCRFLTRDKRWVEIYVLMQIVFHHNH